MSRQALLAVGARHEERRRLEEKEKALLLETATTTTTTTEEKDEEPKEESSSQDALEIVSRALEAEQVNLQRLQERWESLDGEMQERATAARERCVELSLKMREVATSAATLSLSSNPVKRTALDEKRRRIQGQARLVERWTVAAELAKSAALGDAKAMTKLRKIAEDDPRFTDLGERAGLACWRRCEATLKEAATAVDWPFGAVKDRTSRNTDPELVAKLVLATSTAWDARLPGKTKRRPVEVFAATLVAPIEIRFAAHFEGAETVQRDKPGVPASWLGRVASACCGALSAKKTSGLRAACSAIRRTCVALARRHVLAALPFENTQDAEDHVAAYAALEEILQVPPGDGPLADVARAHFSAWLAADRAAVARLVSGALADEDALSSEPRVATGAAPLFDRRYVDASKGPLALLSDDTWSEAPQGRGTVAWDIAATIAAVVRRAATLEPQHRLEVTKNALTETNRVLGAWLKPRTTAVAIDDLLYIINDRRTGCVSRSKQRSWSAWLGAAGAIRLAHDLAIELRTAASEATRQDGSLPFDSDLDDTDVVARDQVNAAVAAEYNEMAEELTMQVDSFGERMGSLAAAALVTGPRAPESWLGTFFDEIRHRLPGRAAGAGRSQVRTTKLAELVNLAKADDPTVASRAAALARAFQDGDVFRDVVVLTSLGHDRRHALVTAFEALCLDETSSPIPTDKSDSRARKKRLRDLDTALARVDDAADASLRAMLAANDVHRLDPRPAAAILVASI